MTTKANAQLITVTLAREVLTALKDTENVLQVYVFGSVARRGFGKDLDVIVVVDSFKYIDYLLKLQKFGVLGQTDAYAGFGAARRDAFFLCIAGLPDRLRKALREFPADVDIHVMPRGWKRNIAAVQRHLPYKDPHFIENISDDARMVNIHKNGNVELMPVI